jgi:FtsP/CotA-like multicopper oxidase with cupredoxin domain
LTVDDLLLQDGQIAAFHRSGPTHTMMGRFGTVLLINGQTDASFDVTPGEVVRLYFTNTANTRVFNVAIIGATLKLIGGDSGRYEQEFVESVLLSPSERAIVDVLFDHAGTAVLEHRTPHHTSTLATFHVAGGEASPSFIKLARVGTRTERPEPTVAFFPDLLGLRLALPLEDFWVLKLPDGSKVEVFGPDGPVNRHFTTGSVAGFLVDDVFDATEELRSAGVKSS